MSDGDHIAGPETLTQEPRAQTAQQQMQVRIDERAMVSSYANAFRTKTTPEEVIIDFGFNTTTQQAEQAAMTFRVSDRIIMNYHSAKRLAATLSQLIRRHESPSEAPEPVAAKSRPKTSKKSRRAIT